MDLGRAQRRPPLHSLFGEEEFSKFTSCTHPNVSWTIGNGEYHPQIAKLSLPTVHRLSSSIFPCSFVGSFVRPTSVTTDISTYLHYMVSTTIQTMYFLLGYVCVSNIKYKYTDKHTHITKTHTHTHQCIISESSAHGQCITSHQCIIHASSTHCQCIIRADDNLVWFFDDIFSRLFGWGVPAKNLGLVNTQILSIKLNLSFAQLCVV